MSIAEQKALYEERTGNVSRHEDVDRALAALAEGTNGGITSAQGTGLLLSCALAPRYKTYGANSTEDYLRRRGLGVIHGGEHSLRFTPIFDITEKEVNLILELTQDALLNGPVAST